MPKRVIAALLLLTLLPQLTGCTVRKRQQVPTSQLETAKEGQSKETILGVTTAAGEVVWFDPPGGQLARDTIVGYVSQDKQTIPLTEVQRVWVERTHVSALGTIALVLGISAVVLTVAALIALATKESCPFIYSWDGEQYVFDAEPYGGAVTRGLERDDYSELENLRAVDGLYRLIITNEVNETQYTNSLDLWVVDHPPGTRVVADEWGNLHGLTSIQPPLMARDRAGNDLLPWLRATDQLIWEPEPIPSTDGELRQSVVMTFAKPEDVKQAKLVANAVTGLWGSHMIREMLELRGREVGAWYAAIDRNPAEADSLRSWVLREELYALKVYVEEPTGWQVRGTLPGGGPFIAEDRVVPLDVSRVTGTELRIRIEPPAGFWALNSFAVDYSSAVPMQSGTVTLLAARDEEGRDWLTELRSTDDSYYEMPRTGDRAFLTFPAPPERPGMERTVFLHSRGYYRLHLSEDGEPDAITLREITETPGAAARHAAERYAEWRAGRSNE